MVKKKTLTSIIKNSIESYPYIHSSLTDGLVNYSALARKLKNDINSQMGSDISEESVVVSIKRFADELQRTELQQDMPEILSRVTISTTEDVSCLILESKEETLNEIREVLHQTEWNLDEIRLILQAASKVFVLLSQDKMNDLVEKLHDTEMIVKKEIAMLSMKIPEGGYNNYGLLHELTSALAKKGINIEEVVTLPPSIHFVIEESSLSEAHESIKEIINSSKEIVKKRNSVQ